MEFVHQTSGTAKEVTAALKAKRQELAKDGQARDKALTDASVGGVLKVLEGMPDDAQATVTAQVLEKTENGKLVLCQVYVDVTILPGTADVAPTSEAKTPAPVAAAAAAAQV